METRANYILIGLFTLFGIAGAFGFFIWLAKVEVDRQYEHYDILFESVSGLDRAADVRFNGLSVGRVLSLELYADNPSKVIVRIEVSADTPIKTDTKAQLQSQGVTGVAYVSLAGGSPTTALLVADTRTPVPVITAQRSVVQALTADAPDLLAVAVELMRRIEQLVSDENLVHIAAVLANLNSASDLLPAIAARTDSTLEATTHSIHSIDRVLLSLQSILVELSTDIPILTLSLKNSLIAVSESANTINETVTAGGPAVEEFVDTGLPQYVRLARETRDLVKSLKQLTAHMERDPARFFFGNNVPELRR